MMQGSVDVGYNFLSTFRNKRTEDERVYEVLLKNTSQKERVMYPLSLRLGQIIGLYEMWFHQPSRFIYRSSLLNKPSLAFFIRRRNWQDIIR